MIEITAHKILGRAMIEIIASVKMYGLRTSSLIIYRLRDWGHVALNRTSSPWAASGGLGPGMGGWGRCAFGGGGGPQAPRPFLFFGLKLLRPQAPRPFCIFQSKGYQAPQPFLFFGLKLLSHWAIGPSSKIFIWGPNG